jgi:hypothetical protein
MKGGGTLIPPGTNLFGWTPSMSIEVGIQSSLEAHHTKLYVSLCWTSAGNPHHVRFEGFR